MIETDVWFSMWRDLVKETVKYFIANLFTIILPRLYKIDSISLGFHYLVTFKRKIW